VFRLQGRNSARVTILRSVRCSSGASLFSGTIYEPQRLHSPTPWHAPAVYWFFGGDDPEVYDKAKKDGALGALPANHNPRFAPVIHPTLQTGVKALVVAAHAWLAS